MITLNVRRQQTTLILRRQSLHEVLPDTGMTKDKPNRNRDQTSKEGGRGQTGQKRDATDERLHYCERRRWKRGREERGAQQEETTRTT